MKKIILSIALLACSLGLLHAQNDTMYIMRQGKVLSKHKVAEVDSIIFYKPAVIKPIVTLDIATALIPAGTFTMGSSTTEISRENDETQHQVTLSAFKMSKYETTNLQFAAFLNAKGVGSNGIYTAGAYPNQILIYASISPYDFDFGLHYTNSKWVPVADYENTPVIFVTWYGAIEFATYAGGRLPTEAEWEYACRANTTTPFNTGTCLADAQANYNWGTPYSTCTNNKTTFPCKTQAVGAYAANAFGLYDMHGNVWEWCNDWYGDYPTTAQTNPTGAATGSLHVIRGGSWHDYAENCRSAFRLYDPGYYYWIGFRIVLAP